MLQETYLTLLNEELNKLEQYTSEKKELFTNTLVSPSNECINRSLELTVLISECSQRITFYECQLQDLGFYDECQDEIILNQTLTGNC